MKATQINQGVMEDFLSVKGRLLEDGPLSNSLRIVDFAGHFVPEEGLLVSPPTGGDLTVWPDGSYVFTSSAAKGGGVATHYSYVVEAADGLSFIGSFSLGEETDASESMQDFQAWSLPDLMDFDGAAKELLDDVWIETMSDYTHDASALVHTAEHLDSATLDSEFDDGLARLILDSQNS